jgi:hypothetical protein
MRALALGIDVDLLTQGAWQCEDPTVAPLRSTLTIAFDARGGTQSRMLIEDPSTSTVYFDLRAQGTWSAEGDTITDATTHYDVVVFHESLRDDVDLDAIGREAAVPARTIVRELASDGMLIEEDGELSDCIHVGPDALGAPINDEP